MFLFLPLGAIMKPKSLSPHLFKVFSLNLSHQHSPHLPLNVHHHGQVVQLRSVPH